jgi:hypothetical protein
MHAASARRSIGMRCDGAAADRHGVQRDRACQRTRELSVCLREAQERQHRGLEVTGIHGLLGGPALPARVQLALIRGVLPLARELAGDALDALARRPDTP